jgi:hypothetical protein
MGSPARVVRVGGLTPHGLLRRRSRASEDEAKRTGVESLGAEAAVLGVPRSRLKVCAEGLLETLIHLGADEAPRRVRAPRTWVQQGFRAPVVGLGESVGAVERDRNRPHLDIPAET